MFFKSCLGARGRPVNYRYPHGLILRWGKLHAISRHDILQEFELSFEVISVLTLQGPLEEVAEMHPARPLAYADDTFLQGAPGPTMQAYQALTALAAPLGLHAQ
jgi:hypothetical protein